MKKRFQIDIAFDDEAEVYHAHIYSITDHKMFKIKRTSLRKLLFAINKFLRDKNSEVRHFPMPEESVIIAPDSNGAISLIVPAHN